MSNIQVTPIPVTIITGFLGSGKTTLLNHILKKNTKTRYAIIENEFGEQGIDGAIVVKPDETIVEINSGCLCCTLNDNLYEILNELHTRRDDFDEIIIEATGVADPSGLAQPFISHPVIKKHFPLASIICLVDAELISDQLLETEEALNQISFSDIILVNKIDLVEQDYLDKIMNHMKELNPLASIIKGDRNNFPVIDYRRTNDRLEEVFVGSTKAKGDQDNLADAPYNKPHTHHDHQHTERINSLSFILDRPFDLNKLKMQMSIYLLVQAKGLYRIKGLIWIKDKNQQYLFQSVGKRFNFEPHREWKTNEPKSSTIVFIGQNLKRPGLERFLKTCM